MIELSADIHLRPTRIGFLTSPMDLTGVAQIMRASACVLGGVYNPIVPVFKRAPQEWKPEIFQRFKGTEIAKGYVRFFEPDVYVETREGLLEDAGLGALRAHSKIHPQVLKLGEFLKPDDGRDYSEPAFGLSVTDVLAHIYTTERQFARRDERPSLYVSPRRGTALSEAMFGVYPSQNDTKYIRQVYDDIFRPDVVEPTPAVWRQVFLDGADTPLHATSYGLDTKRYWYHDLVIFVFDPARATDLIDLWNLRQEPHPVLPIPIDWFGDLADDIQKIVRAEYQPVVGNPHGMMHNSTIEFGRSISRDRAELLLRSFGQGVPKGALVVKYWRNAVWEEHRDLTVHRENRLSVIAKERRATLTVKDGDKGLRTSFEPLYPEFATKYGKGDTRWVNVLNLAKLGSKGVATTLPFNIFDRGWPRIALGAEPVAVTSEGWAFPQQFKNLSQYVTLLSDSDAIVGALKQLGIKAELSEPGHIAKQMLEHLGGLWGVHRLADIETLKLLNKMAGGLRRKSNVNDVVEETFELRTASLKDWVDLISARGKQSMSTLGLEDFTKSNVIRLGLETDCPHCRAKNWSTLTAVDYKVTCERCLKSYDFPQASLREHNRNFTYRVVGPFSVPDYGRGSYSALLTLRFLDRFDGSASEMTFSTALNLSFDGLKREVDFAAWHGDERLGGEHSRPPRLVIGEAKSLGKGDLITAKDLAKLKSVAAKLPDAIIAISVLRDHFTATEKRILKPFVNWARRVNIHGEPTNPVLLLTAHELTMDYLLTERWKKLGGPHAQFADFNHTRTLLDVADATQRIYLGLSSFSSVRQEYWKKRAARRRAAQQRPK